MPDISMCANSKCPLALKCYRYMAKPDPHRQSYGAFEFKLNEEGKPECDHFWEINPDKTTLRKEA
jgi:hypothetical protein